MADYSESKYMNTYAYPVLCDEASNLFSRVEPILTPTKLKSKFLKGVEGLSDYTNTDLKNEIEYAMDEFESESKLFVTKVKMKERIPFDRRLYQKMVYVKTQHGPILSIDDFSVVSSNGEHIYRLPSTWIEMGQANRRQINLIPILSIFGATNVLDSQASNSGLIFITAVNNFAWLPAFFTIEYTVGLSHTDGQIPKIVNDIIGMTAAIEILSVLQTKIKYTSTSVGQDGLSQAASGQGTQTYQPRIQLLTERRDKMMGQVKAKFHSKYYLSNI